MEFIAGQTLKEVIPAKRSASLTEAIDYAIQIARGLAKAHESGVVASRCEARQYHGDP